MTDLMRHLTLDNGLTLTLRHAPRLKRAAAALRVHAGSHDAPPAWPGLAHFLEHLLFLGTARFPQHDGLMRYVQAAGGEVNASTRARTTDFFFELPPALLPGALERLCQMLAEPDLSRARQQAEREVIHAEFIAWSRSVQAQRQFALLQCVSPRHPASGFQAGNRYTLAIHSPAFQEALRDFHARFYRAGQLSLSLCGPQPLDELEALGRQFGAVFADSERIVQQAPPALLDDPLPAPCVNDDQLDLLLAFEQLPAAAQHALEWLEAHVLDSRAGGWLAALRERGWLQACQCETLYSFEGQLLFAIRLQLAHAAPADEVQALLHGWLGFLRHAELSSLAEAFTLLQHSRQRAASALELARRDSAGHAFGAPDARTLEAFRALLERVPAAPPGAWHLPPPEPLLFDDLPPARAALPSDIRVDEGLPAARECSAVYLRWRVESACAERLHTVLCQALQPLLERARRSSVQLEFSAAGEYWQLRCSGAPAAVIRTVEQALAHLRQPDPSAWQTRGPTAVPLIPLRALLKALPGALQPASTSPQATRLADPSALERLWRQARRHGLVTGFTATQRAALGAVLDVMPHEAPVAPDRMDGVRRWVPLETGGSEHALLLFCPLPASLEAAGRLLAQGLQGPVYQRLRVELQLGYAVFSAFRQIDGRSGLLFGVQSAQATPAQILDHLLTLLAEGIKFDPAARQALADQFQEHVLPNVEIADRAWQTYLATEPSDIVALRRTILNTGPAQLDPLLQQVLAAEHGWLCLANAAAPDAQWQ